jgi:hypothetical protein
MTETKITFTKNKITTDNDNCIELSVQNFKFPTEKGDKEIEKISFEGLPSDGGIINKKDELEKILRIGGDLELSFDDSKVNIKVIEPQEGNFMISMAAGPAPENQHPKIRVYEENKNLNIE